jgi:hypothetical protein
LRSLAFATARIDVLRISKVGSSFPFSSCGNMH